ncbi:hypothetical protein [Burkholderia gladioli]|uniref:hypothetical protein n=1 Tax=Burkholderia gladioli TaxID=28095 RepID=UPI0011876420|nr:hypothetical protein [Burkholderia gladioli]MBU9186014.1 hypothetical protein [Burkholderia gladioli]
MSLFASRAGSRHHRFADANGILVVTTLAGPNANDVTPQLLLIDALSQFVLCVHELVGSLVPSTLIEKMIPCGAGECCANVAARP